MCSITYFVNWWIIFCFCSSWLCLRCWGTCFINLTTKRRKNWLWAPQHLDWSRGFLFFAMWKLSRHYGGHHHLPNLSHSGILDQWSRISHHCNKRTSLFRFIFKCDNIVCRFLRLGLVARIRAFKRWRLPKDRFLTFLLSRENTLEWKKKSDIHHTHCTCM